MNQVLTELKSEPGRLTFRGVRYLLIRPETLVGFQKAAGADDALAAGGFEGGRRSSQRLAETLKGREVVEAMGAMGGDIGWGAFRVVRFDGKGFEVEVQGSPFAEAYGPSNRPVCHLLRGVLRGVGVTVYGNATAVEVECVAAGGKVCRFECHA